MSNLCWLMIIGRSMYFWQIMCTLLFPLEDEDDVLYVGLLLLVFPLGTDARALGELGRLLIFIEAVGLLSLVLFVF